MVVVADGNSFVQMKLEYGVFALVGRGANACAEQVCARDFVFQFIYRKQVRALCRSRWNLRQCEKLQSNDVQYISIIWQVRFKSEFYGYSTSYPSPGSGHNVSAANGAAVEWKALQLLEPPVVLAEHLTWLRDRGRYHEPRLLTTIAHRPTDSRLFLSQDGEGDPGKIQGESLETRVQPQPPDVAVVPLGPFVDDFDLWGANGVLQATGSIGSESGPRHLNSGRVGSDGRLQRKVLAHEHSLGAAGGEPDRNEENDKNLVETDSCKFFHLVVDGVIFQVDAVEPKGVWRVWANLIPAVRDMTALWTRSICL